MCQDILPIVAEIPACLDVAQDDPQARGKFSLMPLLQPILAKLDHLLGKPITLGLEVHLTRALDHGIQGPPMRLTIRPIVEPRDEVSLRIGQGVQ